MPNPHWIQYVHSHVLHHPQTFLFQFELESIASTLVCVCDERMEEMQNSVCERAPVDLDGNADAAEDEKVICVGETILYRAHIQQLCKRTHRAQAKEIINSM